MTGKIIKRSVDWGHVAFISVIATIIGIYLLEVLSVSTNLNNIILVVPLALLLLVLVVVLIVGTLRSEGEGQPHNGDVADQEGGDLIRVMILLGGLGIYVTFYQYIGLDVATFAFVAGGLAVLGVRGWVFVPVFSAIFAVIVVGGADLLLHYPMYLAILP
jgi:hypothetical protein